VYQPKKFKEAIATTVIKRKALCFVGAAGFVVKLSSGCDTFQCNGCCGLVAGEQNVGVGGRHNLFLCCVAGGESSAAEGSQFFDRRLFNRRVQRVRFNCNGRVNEDEYDIWLPLFGSVAKYIWRGSGAGTNVSGDAVSRGDLRILSGSDLSFDPHG
jgi:hypothetical protein